MEGKPQLEVSEERDRMLQAIKCWVVGNFALHHKFSISDVSGLLLVPPGCWAYWKRHPRKNQRYHIWRALEVSKTKTDGGYNDYRVIGVVPATEADGASVSPDGAGVEETPATEAQPVVKTKKFAVKRSLLGQMRSSPLIDGEWRTAKDISSRLKDSGVDYSARGIRYYLTVLFRDGELTRKRRTDGVNGFLYKRNACGEIACVEDTSASRERAPTQADEPEVSAVRTVRFSPEIEAALLRTLGEISAFLKVCRTPD